MARTDEIWDNGIDETYIKTSSPTGYNVLINGQDKYLNFNTLSGLAGYGFRDNSGVIEFKNSAGAWVPIPTVSGYTGDLNDSTYTKIATVVNGLITGVEFVVSGGNLLLEDGFYLLLEDGFKLQLE
jgi:hypothetical protein